jgi:hypothetical protein
MSEKGADTLFAVAFSAVYLNALVVLKDHEATARPTKNANSIRSSDAKWQRADGIGILCGLAVAFPNWSKALVSAWRFFLLCDANSFPS